MAADSEYRRSGVILDSTSTGLNIGRQVRVTSIGFAPGKALADVLSIVDAEGGLGCDLIVLPETFLGQTDDSMESLDGPSVTGLSALASKYGTYIVCPVDRMENGRRLNTAVLLDRRGAIAGCYNKVFPYWSEFRHSRVVEPGWDSDVFKTDFGQLGIAICFDVNFPEVWARMADQNAELVAWPSAYSAGSTLQAHALIHHFYIVTSTYHPDCAVYDINGREILYEVGASVNVTRTRLDLDRCIFHTNFNMGKLGQLLCDHPDDIELEEEQVREQWFILRAKRPGISARELARHYGLEELRAYIGRSRAEIDAMRSLSVSNAVH